MAKKKSPNLQEIKNREIELKQRFIERIKMIGTTMVGTEIFSLIPNYVLNSIFQTKSPGLKAKATPGSDILKHTVVQYNKLMTAFISEHSIDGDKGEKIPLGWYLTEGVILTNYMSIMSDNHFPYAGKVKDAFREYLPETEHSLWVGEMLETILFDTTIFLSELDKYIIHTDLTETAFFNLYTSTNAVFIQRFRPEKTKMMIDNYIRTIIKLGWVTADENWQYTKIKPVKLGFKGKDAEIPIYVYIQQHAINKLQERIDITPGIMHFSVCKTFDNDIIPHLKKDNHCLVNFELSEQKVGYLVVKWVDNKLVISTFLFLTNDSTPEGKMLEELLLLQQADKKYLGIDTLPSFNAYHIEDNEELSALFIAAGCGSLLKLRKLEEFSKKVIKDKDPESILKYISDFGLQ